MQKHQKNYRNKKISELLEMAIKILKSNCIDNPYLDAEIMLCFCTKMSKVDLLINMNEYVTLNEQKKFKQILYRRIKGEPIAYIIGEKEFWSFSLKINRNVLIPRPETEFLVEEAILYIKSLYLKNIGIKKISILEIGTGSGAISIALAKEIINCTIIATDISKKAIQIAILNAKKNNVLNKISFQISNLFKSIVTKKKFDLIISNPPYLSKKEYQNLSKKNINFEPKIALFAGINGTFFHEKIINDSPFFLKDRRLLLLEIGFSQKQKIQNFFKKSNYKFIVFKKDFSNNTRLVKAFKN